MKTIIYYFTGTGNSLAVAKKICGSLGDCEPVPIASFDVTKEEIVPRADRVGIVCPVYFLGLPTIVARFAEKLDLSRSGYTFAVVTFGGSGGSAALRQLDGILKARPGRGLDAGFKVHMPGNYILMYSSPAGDKRSRILAWADEQVAAITKEIDNGIMQKLPYSPFAQLFHALMYPRFARTVHDSDRKFTVTGACTSCGTCVEICPAGNIDLVDGRPSWKHHCELCCACIHLCPAKAIEAGPATARRESYRNPSVSVAELKRSTKK
ncbi:MAG: EFR1 family ferrodoxin [Methanoregula sp.]|nr:MAG: EFR1 family ferrodoxin [Methanoregula sp.]